jgi:uncharacterized protein (DUF305 family)
MTRTTTPLTGLAGALLTGALLLAGCADDSSDAAGHGSMTSGSSASASPSADAETTVNDADVEFAAGMLPHHRQAIEMSALAADRAADPRVKELAARIEDAQGPEIATLTGWLAEWGVEEDAAGMDHDRMGHGEGGMMSEQDMRALMRASGTEFDRLFLEQMIAHHRGAVEMATVEAAEGRDPDAIPMAEAIRDTQNAEIAEMQALLDELAG